MSVGLLSIIELAGVGLDVAAKAVALCDQLRSNAHASELRLDSLESLIRDSSTSLRQSIQSSADVIVEKIEQDKLEELYARLQNIEMLLRLKKPDHLLSYVLTLRESVNYAKNRLAESKKHWFTPYLIGQSMVASALTCIGHEDPQMTSEVEKVLDHARKLVLTEVINGLILSGKDIPWESVRNALNGHDGAIERINEHLAMPVDMVGRWGMICRKPCGQEDIGDVFVVRDGRMQFGYVRLQTPETLVRQYIDVSVNGLDVEIETRAVHILEGQKGYRPDLWVGTFVSATTVKGTVHDIGKEGNRKQWGIFTMSRELNLIPS